MSNQIQGLRGQCHCGAVKFSLELTDAFQSIRRCNCSFCRMRGAVAISVALSAIDVYQGKDQLTEYRFNTRQAVHYFCSICGIYTFHQRRSNPEQYAVNVACLENVSPFDFRHVPVMDGIHHPKDGGGGIVGYLDYIDLTPS
ncbi:aldehyde-activating protein [Acinetobacter larvae]|uniref:Aldehyde-activating protein n=2 Tax=Acinetobacter larvae TaxID=1789224 RepID=A0A1B2M3N2_9GAMM|nr:aldehyde-activating protein [Acinetobacter larvae]